MNRTILILFNIVCLSTVLVSAGTTNRHLLDVQDDLNKGINDAKNEVEGFFNKWYGGVCAVDDNCLEVSIMW